MSTWKAASRDDVEGIITNHLRGCTEAQRALFDELRVPLEVFPIDRHGNIEQVYVVARVKDAVIFWEDVEEGFEMTTTDEDDVLRDYAASQFDLSHVMHRIQSGQS